MENEKSKEERPRLVVYITKSERDSIENAAKKIGLKNRHQWAGMKLAVAIREAVEDKN